MQLHRVYSERVNGRFFSLSLLCIRCQLGSVDLQWETRLTYREYCNEWLVSNVKSRFRSLLDCTYFMVVQGRHYFRRVCIMIWNHKVIPSNIGNSPITFRNKYNPNPMTSIHVFQANHLRKKKFSHLNPQIAPPRRLSLAIAPRLIKEKKKLRYIHVHESYHPLEGRTLSSLKENTHTTRRCASMWNATGGLRYVALSLCSLGRAY